MDLPEISQWNVSPNTYLIFLIFVSIDRAMLQGFFVLVYWTVQFQIGPIIKETERDTVESVITGAMLLLALLLSTINKNRTGLNYCNERVSRQENWTFMTDCAKNIIKLKPEESFKVSFTKLSGALKKILVKSDDGSIFGKQILFDGLLPIDLR